MPKGLGGLPPMRPDQHADPPSSPVSPGSAAGIVLARTVVVSGTSGSGSSSSVGVFLYNGIPAFGNPPIVSITSHSTDPYGNPVIPGLDVTQGSITGTAISGGSIAGTTITGGTISGTTFTGPDFIINSSGVFIYSGVPANGNLITSMAGAAGSDAFGNSYPQGFGVSAGTIPGGLINAGTVGTAQLAALAVTAAKIAANTITTSQISASAGILGSQIAALTIGASNLIANTITAAQIAAGTITTTQIASGTIVAGNIASGTITGTQIAAGTITASNILSGTITALQIAAATITGTQIAAGTITASNILSNTITALQIAAGAITTTQIAANTIVAGNIASGTITGTQIAATTIAAGNIISGTITGTQIAATTIAAGNIVSGTITTTQIAANTIVAGNIAAGTITGAKIAAGTITASNILTSTITATQLAAGIIYAGIVNGTTITGASIVADGSSGQILIYSGTPATGNLIGSWSGAAGTDGFSNSYPQGLSITQGTISGSTFSGSNFIINSAGAFFYSGTPAAGNLVSSITTGSGTDAFGNSYINGITNYLNSFLSDAYNAQLSVGTLALNFPSQTLGGQVSAGPVQDALGNNIAQTQIWSGCLDSGFDVATVSLNAGNLADGTPASIVLSSFLADSTTFADALSITGSEKVGSYSTAADYLVYAGGAGKQIITYTAPSTRTWTAPTGVTSVVVECWGGSAGGAGGGLAGGANSGGLGGGGGAYAKSTVTVVPGTGYTVVVGAGGAGATPNNLGSNGTSSKFNSTSVVAQPGVAATIGVTGKGGLASASTGTTKNSGGNGGTASSTGGSGAGGSGGSTGAGGTGASNTGTGVASGGTAGTGGGAAGGSGGSANNNGGSGAAPGGGGGGGGGGASAGNGISGSNGQVRLTYTPAASSLTAALVGTAINDPVNGTSITPGLYLGNQSLSPAAAGLGCTMYANSGMGAMVNASGLVGNLSMSNLSAPGTTPVTGTALTSIGFRSIPANDVIVGAAYQIHGSGVFSVTSTPPASVTFSVYWGGTGGTQISSLAIPAAGIPTTTLTTAGWYADAEVVFTSTTATEVTFKVGFHSGSGVSAGVQYFSVIDTTGLTTTSSENLSLCFQWGTGGSPSLVVGACRIGRIA